MDKTHASLDRLFELLAHRRRRYVLYYLDEVDGAIATLDDLADTLCTWERTWVAYTEHPRGKHQEHIQIDLHHVHLPQLAAAGLLDYDARTGTVRSRTGDSLLEIIQQESEECPRLAALFTDIEMHS